MSLCLITGATSQVGWFLLPELQRTAPDLPLLVLARRPRPEYLPAGEHIHWLLLDKSKLGTPINPSENSGHPPSRDSGHPSITDSGHPSITDSGHPSITDSGHPPVAGTGRDYGHPSKSTSKSTGTPTTRSEGSEAVSRLAGSLRQATELIALGPVALTARLLPECPRLRRVIQITTSSIDTKKDSADADERAMVAAIAREEEHVRAICRERGIICQVLRPTMIYGAGLDANVCSLARIARLSGTLPVAGQASGLRQPVHAHDLALAILRLRGYPHSGLWHTGGGSTLSYRELAEKVCEAAGRGRVVTLPAALLGSVIRLARSCGMLRGVSGAMPERQNVDLVVDHSRAISDWGWSPRRFRLDPGMLEPPRKPHRLQD